MIFKKFIVIVVPLLAFTLTSFAGHEDKILGKRNRSLECSANPNKKPRFERSECEICNTVLHNRSNMRRHVKQLHTPFECCECHEMFLGKKALREHIHEEHKPLSRKLKQPYRCEICQIEVKLLRNLKPHFNSAGHLAKLKELQKSFPNRSVPPSERIECPYCYYLMISRIHLSSHLRTCNEETAQAQEQLPNYCADCRLSFGRNASLKRHYETDLHLSVVRAGLNSELPEQLPEEDLEAQSCPDLEPLFDGGILED